MPALRPPMLPLACASLAAILPSQDPWKVPHRGALVYDRTVEGPLVGPKTGPFEGRVVIRSTEAGGHRWRYATFGEPGPTAGWERPEFDDSGWSTGLAMFGGRADDDPLVRTPWNTKHICLRTTVDLGRRKPKAALLRIHHDDGVVLYWNGNRVLEAEGAGRDRLHALMGDTMDAWRRGENLFAAQCTNTGGALYIDVELALLPRVPRDIRTTGELVERARSPDRVARRVRGSLFPSYRAPAMLLHGELDASSRKVRMRPVDLRDLGWFVAMDLTSVRGSTRLQYDLPRILHFGDLRLTGRADTPDQEGWQDLELEVENDAPAPRGENKRFVEKYLIPHHDHTFAGVLRVRRRIERHEDGARVTHFETELTGDLGVGTNAEGEHSFEHREEWRLRQVRANSDAAFRQGVAEAITKGCEYLRKALAKPDAGDTGPGTGGNRSYGSGRLALALLAMLKGGVPRDDEVVERGLDSLREREIVDTYSLGIALMALEAAYAPPNEYGDLRMGVIDRPRPRTPTPDDLAVMERWVERLLKNTDTRDDPTELLRFGYVGEARFDNSVNQYGLLGLYSAHLCGVDIDPRLWEAGIRHLVAAQCEPTGRIGLDLVDYRTHARAGNDTGTPRTTARATFPAAGWAYQEPRSGGMFVPAYGSMTCAGIAGLALCEAALADSEYRADQRLLNQATLARMSGLAWVAEHLQVRYHPGWMPHQQRWIYYYLYGLERAAVLSGIALIQDRDWYFEGAMALIELQERNGSWPGEMHADPALDRTAMAVLFLKKASLPVLTGR